MGYTPDWYNKDRLIRTNEIMRDYQRYWGESVLWSEYNAMAATTDQVYDEGPSRAWYPPVTLPVMFLDFHQEVPQDTDQGFYVLSTASVCFQVTSAADRFRINPLFTASHFRDRFSYDNTVYRVLRYSKQGFVHGTYLTVSAMGEQVKPEEMVNDSQQQDQFVQTMVW